MIKRTLRLILATITVSLFSVSANAQECMNSSSGDEQSAEQQSQQHCHKDDSGNSARNAEDRAVGQRGDRPRQRGAGRGDGAGGRHGMNMSHDRHHFVRDNGLPEEYEDLQNPLESTAANLTEGETVYRTECALCHGESGTGDGEAGVNLDPAPTNIARFAQMRMASDDFLFWTLSEGGGVIGSAMPAFKQNLSEQQIWQVILYLRQMNAEE